MSLQARIGTRIRQLREAKNVTQEELAGMARSDAATLSRIESGKRNITAETLALFLIALNITPKDFFGSAEFGQTLAINPDDPDSINSDYFSVEELGIGTRIHFPCGKYEASLDVNGLDRQKIANAVLMLRRGLRQAELTPQVDNGTQEETTDESTTTKVLMSAAIAESFLSLVQGKTDVNSSDVWRYIISRAFCDPQNHPGTSARKNFEQSFKRTGGWAFERVLAAHYGPFLGRHDVVLTRVNAGQLLTDMGLAGQIPLDKIDLFIVARQGDSMKPLGVIHLKSSLAERRTDDVPASQLIMGKGFLSMFVTLDAKDAPSSQPVNKGEYGPALIYNDETKTWKGSEKRKDIELNGLFSVVFSFNSRTIESRQRTASGRRIAKIDFSNPDDAFSRFILESRKRILGRKSGMA